MSQYTPTFGASGSGHSEGSVPDPGSTAGTGRYLREDATWFVPPHATPGPPPPSPGPAFNQWACNIAGWLTYDVARLATKWALDMLPISFITDVAAGIFAGLVRALLIEDPIIAAIAEDMVFHFVHDHLNGIATAAISDLLGDALWARVHCALYDAISASPTDFLAALTAAAGVIAAFVGFNSAATAAIAYFLSNLGIKDVFNIPLTAFVTNYDCSTCATTHVGPTPPVLQKGFDLTVDDGTNKEHWVDDIHFDNAVVSASGSTATVHVPPDLTVSDGVTTVTAVDDIQTNHILVAGTTGTATLTAQVGVEHNASTVGVESNIDFVDSLSATWVMTDAPVSHAVHVSAVVPLGSDSAPGIVQGDGSSTYVDGSGIMHAGGYQLANLCSAVGTGVVLDIGAMPSPGTLTYPYTALRAWIAANAPSGWQNVSFTETGWIASVASRSEAGVFNFPPGSATVAPNNTASLPDGQTFLLRHHFDLPAGPVGACYLAINADDYMVSAYLNGTLLGGLSQQLDYRVLVVPAELLTSTNNVLALAITNGGGWYATGYCVSLLIGPPPTVEVEHNEESIGIEPGIDFVDSASVQWTVTDDPTNDRVKVQATGSTGTVTTVTASAPLSSSGGATPNIALSTPLATNYGGLGIDTSSALLGTILANSGSGWTGVAPLADGLVATSDHTAPGGVTWDAVGGVTPGSGSVWVANFLTPPSSSHWTVDHGTISDVANGVHLVATAGGTFNHGAAHVALASIPYTVSAAILYVMPNINTTGQVAGIWVGNASNFLVLGVPNGTAGVEAVYSEPGVGNILLTQWDPAVWYIPLFIRIQNDGSNRTGWFSQDGIIWRQYFTEVHTAHLTEDRAGIWVHTTGNTLTLLSWGISYP